jgi:hypothetical protein
MASIQKKIVSGVSGGITFDSFLFSKLIVNGRKVPILVLNGKLVVYPSRFILYSIEKRNVRFRKASRYLKVLAKFIAFLSRTYASDLCPPPDSLLLTADALLIEEFLDSVQSSVRPSNGLVLGSFYPWLKQEEGVNV